MILEFIVRFFVCLFLSSFIMFAQLNLEDDPRYRYSPGLSPLMLPFMLTLILGLSAVEFLLIRNTERDVGGLLAGWCLEMAAMSGLYFCALLLFLPRLRRRLRPRGCASLWLLPNILYVTQYDFLRLSRPLATLWLPRGAMIAILALWGTGFAAVLLYRTAVHLRFRRELLRDAYPERDPEVLALWRKCQEYVGIKPKRTPWLFRKLSWRPGGPRLRSGGGGEARFPLLRSAAVATPISVGVFWRSVRVVLPERDYTKEDLELVFRHELAHIARQDGAAKFFLAFCTAMSWFNPLMWRAMDRCAEDLELSCDETVLMHAEADERRRYASLILRAAGDGRGYTTCLSSTARSLRCRLAAVMHPETRGSAAGIAWLASFLLLFTTGFGCVAWNSGAALNVSGEPVYFRYYPEDTDIGDPVRCTDPQLLAEYLNGLTLYRHSGKYDYPSEDREIFLQYTLDSGKHLYLRLVRDQLWISSVYNEEGQCYFLRGGLDWDYLESLSLPEWENRRPEPPVFSDCQRSLAEFRRPQTAKISIIVFPAACTSEKHFSRSERRIVRLRRTTEAQNGALLSSKKWHRHFFDTQGKPDA